MQRIVQTPRKNWPETLMRQGFHFHSIDDHGEDCSGKFNGEKFMYWREDVAYAFSEKEIEAIYDATQALQTMCMDLASDLVRKGDLARLGMAPNVQQLVTESFLRGDMHLYGRFDLCVNPGGSIKMLEYNADTPTALIESAVAQWNWKQDVHPDADQFNSLHETLIARLKEIKTRYNLETLHLGCLTESQEDVGNLEYMMDVAVQAGLRANLMDMSEVGLETLKDGVQFVDMHYNPIQAMFKLYPWEWIMEDSFAEHIGKTTTHWLEPIWKMILSNKAILPLLWENYRDHPNLLPAYFTPDLLDGQAWVKKPFLSREGANIEVKQVDGTSWKTEGMYNTEQSIYQAYSELPAFDSPEDTGWLGKVPHMYPVVGAWIVGNEPCGIGIREDMSKITKDTSYFVPHYFK